MGELNINQKIIDFRKMTKAELKAEGWEDQDCSVIELEDGTILYPSRDDEGNGPGTLFGKLPNGKTVYIFPEK